MLLIKGAELAGQTDIDVRCRDGLIVEIGTGLTHRGEQIVQARGGALIAGLHDHHMHLFALAAARQSTNCGPPAITNAVELGAALANAPGNDWIRGVGYHESVAGMLDRHDLDRLCADRPVRIQHRSGKR